jgi:tetratricopeptide (TPR) repeat protein
MSVLLRCFFLGVLLVFVGRAWAQEEPGSVEPELVVTGEVNPESGEDAEGGELEGDGEEAVGQVEVPQVETPQFERSWPAHPWVYRAGPVEATLLIIPTVMDGHYYTSGVEWYHVMRQFEYASPVRVATVNQEFVQPALQQMAPCGKEERVPYEERHRELLTRYFGATHVLETFAEVKDDVRTVVARLHRGDDVKEVSFEAVEMPHIANAASIRDWLIEELGDLLTDADAEEMRRPLMGSRIQWSADPEWEILRDDPVHPLWDEIMAESPWAEYLLHRRAGDALDNRRRETYALIVPPPGDGKVGPLYLMARARLLNALGQKETALHDYEICLAMYPGATSQARVFLNTWGPDEMTRGRLVGVFERWHRAMPQAAAWDLLMARAHLTASEAWMVPGLEASRETIIGRVYYHNDEAMKLIWRAHETGGPMPQTLELARRGTGPYHDLGLIARIFADVVESHPESIAPYRSWLRLLVSLDDWHKSAESRRSPREFIEWTLEARPDWPYAYQLFDDYLIGYEGHKGLLEREEYAEEVTANVLRRWIGENEEWKEISRQLAERILRVDPSPGGAARAAGYAWLARDEDLLRRIAREQPRVLLEGREEFRPLVHRGVLRRTLLNGLRRAGHVEEALATTTELVTKYHDWMQETMTEHVRRYYYAHHATLLGLAGRAAEADEWWERAKYPESWQPLRTLSWAVCDHRVTEAREHIARLHAEGQDVAEVTLAETILLARYVGVDAARAFAESRQLHTREDYPLVTRLYREAVGEEE